AMFFSHQEEASPESLLDQPPPPLSCQPLLLQCDGVTVGDEKSREQGILAGDRSRPGSQESDEESNTANAIHILSGYSRFLAAPPGRATTVRPGASRGDP
ncbi:MAG TPA: hypothetical protein VJP77_09645, partial [Planctomycetota bacterium]|nr:hypothetical protein [Planctomycetota bacterium]